MADIVATNQFKNGMHIEVEGEVWRIQEFQHHKPGKGAAVMRTKLRNVETGSTVDKTFRTSEKFPRVLTETSDAQFLYNDGEMYVFMDPTSYEQHEIHESLLGDSTVYLEDGMMVKLMYIGGDLSGVELPTTVERTVTDTEPAVRGDTVGNVMKPATVEGGITVQVPAFVNVDDVLKIDTRDGSYISRA